MAGFFSGYIWTKFSLPDWAMLMLVFGSAFGGAAGLHLLAKRFPTSKDAPPSPPSFKKQGYRLICRFDQDDYRQRTESVGASAQDLLRSLQTLFGANACEAWDSNKSHSKILVLRWEAMPGADTKALIAKIPKSHLADDVVRLVLFGKEAETQSAGNESLQDDSDVRTIG